MGIEKEKGGGYELFGSNFWGKPKLTVCGTHRLERGPTRQRAQLEASLCQRRGACESRRTPDRLRRIQYHQSFAIYH